MISSKIEAAFNKQINEEFYSSYLYLAMAFYMDSQGLAGMSGWLRAHYEEEATHAMKFADYVIERGGTVNLMQIKEPPTEWSSPAEVFKMALEHEVLVSGMINDLVDLALKERDHASVGFTQWFVNEQVEEESTFQEIVDKFALGQDHPGFLYMLDKDLGERQPVNVGTSPTVEGA